jgi:hypothetical protein
VDQPVLECGSIGIDFSTCLGFGQPWSRVHAGTFARYCLKGIQPAATLLYATSNAQTPQTPEYLSETFYTTIIIYIIYYLYLYIYLSLFV